MLWDKLASPVESSASQVPETLDEPALLSSQVAQSPTLGCRLLEVKKQQSAPALPVAQTWARSPNRGPTKS